MPASFHSLSTYPKRQVNIWLQRLSILGAVEAPNHEYANIQHHPHNLPTSLRKTLLTHNQPVTFSQTQIA